MERLSNVGKLTGVEKLSDRWMYYSGLLACMGVPVDDMKHIQNLIDAEEQEKLIRLPCKVGDTVYLVDFEEKTWDEATVNSIEIDTRDNRILINSDYEVGTWSEDSYVFYSKEEAEQALARMEK